MSGLPGEITFGPHKNAYLGEQAIGFMLGSEGYFFVDGPSGGGGHGLTAPGFDGIAYHPEKMELIIYDNKAYTAAGNVSSATAIDPNRNLLKNLDDTIAHVERHPNFKGMPGRIKIMEQMKQTRRAVDQWIKSGLPEGKLKLPGKVKLVVYNAWGNSTGIGAKLAKSGAIEFIDVAKAPAPKARLVLDSELRFVESQTERAGTEAAQAVERRALVKGEKLVVSDAAKLALRRTGLANVMGTTVKRIVQAKAAKRVLSLAPVVGWGFSARDAYAGLKDIMAGHTYRGLAGIGLATTDVLADVLHLGDLVTGVGGTALSLGVQASTGAGQILIETERLEEKMNALQAEIAKTGTMPSDDRLTNEFELDAEAIAQVKAAIAPHLPVMAAEAAVPIGASTARIDEREIIRSVLDRVGVPTPSDNVFAALAKAGSTIGRTNMVLGEMEKNGEIELIRGATAKVTWVIRKRMPAASIAR